MNLRLRLNKISRPASVPCGPGRLERCLTKGVIVAELFPVYPYPRKQAHLYLHITVLFKMLYI